MITVLAKYLSMHGTGSSNNSKDYSQFIPMFQDIYRIPLMLVRCEVVATVLKTYCLKAKLDHPPGYIPSWNENFDSGLHSNSATAPALHEESDKH